MGSITVPTVKLRSIPVVLDGTVQRITTDVNINADDFTFICGGANAGSIYFAYELASGAIPSAITPTSNAVSPAVDALFALDRMVLPVSLSRFMKVQHIPYVLKPFCIQGTAADLLWVIWSELA